MRDSATWRTGFGCFAVKVLLEQFGEGDLHSFCLDVVGAIGGDYSSFGKGRGDMVAWLVVFFDALEREVGGEGATVVSGARSQNDASIFGEMRFEKIGK